MAKETYDKIRAKDLREMKSSLFEQMGRSDHKAENGNYQEAYEELVGEIEEFTDSLNENKEIHFE